MRDGNQIIHADGQMFKQATILKPSTLISENIKKNVEIGGVVGTFAGDEVEKIRAVDYSDYTPIYNETEWNNFKKAENVGKIARAMMQDYLLDSWEYLAYYICEEKDGSYYLTKILPENVPIKEEYEIKADEDTVLTKVTVPKDSNLVSSHIKKGIDINGVTGSFIGNGYEYTTEALNFSSGSSELIPREDQLFSKVIIQKPENLIPSNIREGVVVAGIAGTYKLSGLPTLSAPTAISDITSMTYTQGNDGANAYITISNPTSKNGVFVNECQLFATRTETIDGTATQVEELVARKSVSSGASSVTFYARDWIVDSWPKTRTLKAQFLGTYFNPSTKYTVTNVISSGLGDDAGGGYALTEMEYDLQNTTISISPKKIYWGQQLQGIINAKSGYYRPKKVTVESFGGYAEVDGADRGFTYDNQTGSFTLNYNRSNHADLAMYSVELIKIIAIGTDKPWLKDFVSGAVNLDDNNILTVKKPDINAKRVELKLADKVIYTADFPPSLTPTVTNRGSYRTNVSTSTTDGVTTYQFKSTGSSNGYCVYRYTFTCEEPTNIEITYSQYNYTTYLCGFISKLNYNFSLNYNAESSSNCLFYGSSSTSSTITDQKITVQLPAGTSTIDVKWRGYYGYTSYYFKVAMDRTAEGKQVQINMEKISDLASPGTYNVQVTAEADGYIGTDPVTRQYTSIGAIVDGETLITDGKVTDETITTSYTAVENETLFCNIRPTTVDSEVLFAEGTVSEETLTAEYAAAGEGALLYGVPKED